MSRYVAVVLCGLTAAVIVALGVLASGGTEGEAAVISGIIGSASTAVALWWAPRREG